MVFLAFCSQNTKLGKVGLTSYLCQNLPELLIVRTVRVGSAEPTRRLCPSTKFVQHYARYIPTAAHSHNRHRYIVKRDFDGLPTFFVNSETKSPSSTLTEQVPRESFSTVCLDFRIILPRLMKVSCVPFHQLWPNSNTQHKFLVFFSLEKAKKILVNTEYYFPYVLFGST